MRADERRIPFNKAIYCHDAHLEVYLWEGLVVEVVWAAG